MNTQDVAKQIKGLWFRMKKSNRKYVCGCLPDRMPPRQGNPKRLAELEFDPEYNE